MSDFNTSIIQAFRATEGKVGDQFEGASLILIHHIGAKSGAERVTPVSCFPQPDGRLVIIASNGGALTNPDWYYSTSLKATKGDHHGNPRSPHHSRYPQPEDPGRGAYEPQRLRDGRPTARDRDRPFAR